MKVFTIKRADAGTPAAWENHDILVAFFRNKAAGLHCAAETKASDLASYYRTMKPGLTFRVVEVTRHKGRVLFQKWRRPIMAALAYVLVVAVSMSCGLSYMNRQDRQEAQIRSSILSAVPGGHSPASVAAYDLTTACLGTQGFTEDTTALLSRCQSQSTSYLVQGSFPSEEKLAAQRVVTDIISRQIRLGSL